MDIKAAFRNSPIWPPHKALCVVEWAGSLFVDHVFPFGLATAPSVQGCVADATVDLLDTWDVNPVFKWVDDFNFMREPCSAIMQEDGSIDYNYTYDLHDIISLMDRLGIPWHPIDKKGHDFTFVMTYVGFKWDLQARTVSLPRKKCEKYVARVLAYLDVGRVSLEQSMKLHGTLQHTTFVLKAGNSYLPAISRAITGFKGDRHRRHHVACDARADLLWWKAILAEGHIMRSLLPRLHCDPDVWVDASTSWGIGLVVNGHWAAWRLLE